MTRIADGVRGVVLIHDGHKYQKNKAVGDKVHWRCWRKDCRAPITTDACLNHAGAPVNVIVDPGEHNHPVDFDLISDTLFSQRCTTTWTSCRSAPTSTLMERSRVFLPPSGNLLPSMAATEASSSHWSSVYSCLRYLPSRLFQKRPYDHSFGPFLAIRLYNIFPAFST